MADLNLEVAILKKALTKARAFAMSKGVGLREFSVICGVSPVTMSMWTDEPPTTPPDIVCSRPAPAKLEKPGKHAIRLSGKNVPREELELNDADDAIEQANNIIEMTGDLPEAGYDFGESVAEKCRSMIENLERTRRVTPAQKTALDNMEAGVCRWFRD